MSVLVQIPFKARPWMGDVESSQRSEPSCHFARHGREALGPSDDDRLVAIRTPGEVALEPSEDNEADQQPIAGDGDCGCGRLCLSHLAFACPSPVCLS